MSALQADELRPPPAQGTDSPAVAMSGRHNGCFKWPPLYRSRSPPLLQLCWRGVSVLVTTWIPRLARHSDSLTASTARPATHEDKSPLLFPPHTTLEAGSWMGEVKPDQATRPDKLCLSYNVLSASSKPAKIQEIQKPDPARAILTSGTNFTAKQLYIHHKPDPARAIRPQEQILLQNSTGGNEDRARDRVEWNKLVDESKNLLRFEAPQKAWRTKAEPRDHMPQQGEWSHNSYWGNVWFHQLL
ncbi:hypothetical protein ANN_05259 [Periplaneta americana]|uniref:Uncharacterized protein n=1 Tax=Periplaneta americana TaxID=6978 RepID=A0ABQ8TCL3_PERAM|nr:hypothetical protein ANN_05259 [Periplaneta americana]